MTTNGSQQITQKLWNYAGVLRDDGLSYGDYVEQLTYLLFLKMAHERTQPPLSEAPVVPPEYGWPSLLRRDGAELEEPYRRLLEELAKQPGMLGVTATTAPPPGRRRARAAAGAPTLMTS